MEAATLPDERAGAPEDGDAAILLQRLRVHLFA